MSTFCTDELPKLPVDLRDNERWHRSEVDGTWWLYQSGSWGHMPTQYDGEEWARAHLMVIAANAPALLAPYLEAAKREERRRIGRLLRERTAVHRAQAPGAVFAHEEERLNARGDECEDLADLLDPPAAPLEETDR